MVLLGCMGRDEEDVEVAVVCPLSDLNRVKVHEFPDVNKIRNTQPDFPVVSVDKVREDTDVGKASIARRAQQRFVSETFQCVTACVVLIFVLGFVVVSFFYCQVCLFGIMVVSACLCPFMPYFNIPLWTSILLIVMLGMSYTQRPFTFIWK